MFAYVSDKKNKRKTKKNCWFLQRKKESCNKTNTFYLNIKKKSKEIKITKKKKLEKKTN